MRAIVTVVVTVRTEPCVSEKGWSDQQATSRKEVPVETDGVRFQALATGFLDGKASELANDVAGYANVLATAKGEGRT